ncbi:hypothetical protein RBSH_04996 [Rhodopirellula baltica SH28]|uniref:Uncharacterized protein n=1 Tax=Rhodopirellula baltica SH28 TaxID=993517 RepID=K5DAT7_RHOBT|nr:hypothetical protein RBSH_04996 [Rhodopirellula baltica SH28]
MAAKKVPVAKVRSERVICLSPSDPLGEAVLDPFPDILIETAFPDARRMPNCHANWNLSP